MAEWVVTDELELEPEIADVRDVSVRIIGGELAITAADGPPRLAVRRVRGHDVMVEFLHGTLDVRCDTGGVGGIFRNMFHHRCEAVVVLTVTPGTEATLSTVSAPIVAAGLQAPLRVQSVSGDLALDAVEAEIVAKTVSGEIEARSLVGALRAQTVSGDLTMAGGRCRSLSGKTVSGAITLDVALEREGSYDLTSVSGDVTLRLPLDASVAVDVVSVSGRIDSAFTELGTEARRPGKRSLSGRIGAGDSHLAVKTTSGDVSFLARTAA